MSYKRSVLYYTMGIAELHIPFPEDKVCCFHCSMRYRDSCDRQMCRLLNRELYYIHEGIHEDCPLEFDIKEMEGKQ